MVWGFRGWGSAGLGAFTVIAGTTTRCAIDSGCPVPISPSSSKPRTATQAMHEHTEGQIDTCAPVSRGVQHYHTIHACMILD